MNHKKRPTFSLRSKRRVFVTGVRLCRTGNVVTGFTLIEMVLAIALVFYIGLLSTAFYSGFYLRNAANIVTKDLAFSLRQAQVYSMSGRQGSDWGVALTDDAIIIFKGSSYASRATTFDESHAIPVTLVVTGFNETVFSRITGYPSATSTVVITGAGRTRTVVVNEQGIVDQY